MPNDYFHINDQTIAVQNVEDLDLDIRISQDLASDLRGHKESLVEKINSTYNKLKAVLQQTKNQEKVDSSEIDSKIDLTIDALNEGSSILFIGPEISKPETDGAVSLHEKQYKEISANPSVDAVYNQADGFFEPPEKGHLKLLLHNYYHNIFPEENVKGEQTLKALSPLPFKLIISFAPDDTMHRIFKKFDRDHHFIEYHRKSKMADIKPELDKPVLINAVGNLASGSDQYIYTYNNLYDYLVDAKFPTRVKNEIKQASQLLFLGFDLQKWQSRLLLFMLGINNSEAESDGRMFSAVTDEKLNTFLHDQFNITHVENNYLEFAEDLLQKSQKELSVVSLEKFYLKKQLLKLKVLAERLTESESQEDFDHITTELEKLENHAKSNHGI